MKEPECELVVWDISVGQGVLTDIHGIYSDKTDAITDVGHIVHS